MNKKNLQIKAKSVTWRQFDRKHDAIFRSLGKEIRIGVLAVSMLTYASTDSISAQSLPSEPSESGEKLMQLEDIEVTASRVAQPMGQSARIVSVMTREDIQATPAQSVNDLLKYAAGVDVRQRGAFGIQTDISINGGTHDQIVILLNGVNISSPHTGHLSADFPISVDDIERIEILEGAASRVYGTSAFNGAINIVTKKSKSDNITVSAEGGSYGSAGADASISLVGKNLHNRISGGYQRSDGGTDNSDFNKFRAYYQGDADTKLATFDWSLGMSSQNYGANTFYSGMYPDQYEENRRYMASVSATTKGRIKFTPTMYWNRSLDHFQLIRGSKTGENYHMTDVYGLSANAQIDWSLGQSAIGAEFRNEGILSTSLGKPLDESEYVGIPGHDGYYTMRDNRTNVCYYLEHNVILNRWSISFGVMANMNTMLDYRMRLYPGIDVSYRPDSRWKIYASWNMTQRMPTFTDLYYKSPTQEGNTGLKPEETQELTVGGRFTDEIATLELRAFYRKQHNMIDWVMYDSDSVNNYSTYHATNFKIDNMGVELSAGLNLQKIFGERNPLRLLSLNYAYIHQDRHDKEHIYASCYAMDYLRHKFTARLDGRIWKKLTASLSFRWQERMGSYIKYTTMTGADGTPSVTSKPTKYSPYGILDLQLAWEEKKYEIYFKGNNLTDHRYYDIGNVKQPGFWFMAGAKLKLKI